MIIGELSSWRDYPGLAGNKAWTRAFEWLEKESASASEGFHELGEPGFTARVMRYALKTREAAKYETHRYTIDIHFTLEGTEGIEFARLGNLEKAGDYVAEKEAQFYVKPAVGQIVAGIASGTFAVILPNEPHMTALALPGCANVKKVVIKLPAKLVGIK